MHRISRQETAEAIGAALDLLPAGVRRLVGHARFYADVDPVFAGLHGYREIEHGSRSYRNTAHVCWPVHLSNRPLAERVSTVVLPCPDEPWVIVHELGHVLHEAIGFDTHTPDPVSSYARENKYEAFAEAFAAWLCPHVYVAAQPILLQDKATLTLFEELVHSGSVRGAPYLAPRQ